MAEGGFSLPVALKRLTPRRAALLVALVAALVYANSLGNGFAYDDVPIIQNNPTIQSWGALKEAVFSSYWPGPQGANMALWRPVTTGLLGVQYILTGGAPWLFHVTNVLLHAAASGLLVLLMLRLMALPIALVAGLVFAVHPVHTEAVANVVGVAELISAAALLAACLLHVRGGSRSGWPVAVAIGALYVVGFGAKESAVTLPGLIFLIDAARTRLGFGDVVPYIAARWRTYFVMGVVAVAMLTMRFEILGTVASPAGPLGANILTEIPRIWTLGEIWTHYVRLWVFPLDLSADYSPNVIPISFGWHAANVTGVVLALTVLFVALLLWRKPVLEPGCSSARIGAFGVVWFLIAISPISNTVFLSGVLLAERTLYLPSVGLAAATGWMVVRFARDRPRLAPSLTLLALVAGGFHTWNRNPVWKDNQSMFVAMIGQHPHSGRSQWLLGDNFIERGQIEQGLFAFRATVNLLDADYAVVTHVAGRLSQLERYEGAEGLLDHAIRDQPHVPLAYGQRTGIRAEQGDARGAERYARVSLALYPQDPLRLHVLSWALASRGAWDEALEVRRRADEIGSVSSWHRWVYDAHVARRAGDVEGTRAALDSAWVTVRTGVGRSALDSIMVHDFRVEPPAPPEGVDWVSPRVMEADPAGSTSVGPDGA